MAKKKKLRITQIRSTIGQNEVKIKIMQALGLHKPHHTVIKDDTPSIRGMIKSVNHLVKVEEITAGKR
ncbi:MAG: 50S ribosomal protein L30 [Candidatus Cloacimonadia bacterium]